MTYLERLAVEIESEARPDAPPDADMRDLFLLYAVLAVAKGEATTAPDVHDAWVAWMVMRRRTHRSMVPFSALSLEVQREDDRFVAAIRRVALRGIDDAR